MAGEMAGWCGPDRYVDSQGRVHVAVADGPGDQAPCFSCSWLETGSVCHEANCIEREIHFEVEAVLGPKGTEGGGE